MDKATIAWSSALAMFVLFLSPPLFGILAAIAAAIWLVTALTTSHRDRSQEALSGQYTIPVTITGRPRGIVSVVTYRCPSHTWDVDFIGIEGSKDDIFDQLTPAQKNEAFSQEGVFLSAIRNGTAMADSSASVQSSRDSRHGTKTQAPSVATPVTYSEKCTNCGGILWSTEHGLCANCRKPSSRIESSAKPLDSQPAQHDDPWINSLMRKHGVTRDGVQYLWKGCRFSSANTLVEALKQYERTKGRN